MSNSEGVYGNHLSGKQNQVFGDLQRETFLRVMVQRRKNMFL